jgi:hypothetical protein
MADVVNHLSTFPFGLGSDPLDVIHIWRRVLVLGQEEDIDQFLTDVNTRFEALGWSPNMSIERQMNNSAYPLNRFYCWSTGTGREYSVLLCLNRTSDRRVRGGTYDIDGYAGIPELARAIQYVLQEVVEPAAAAVGLSVSYPRLGPISRVGTRTEAAMTALAEVGVGRWPLPEEAEPVWRQFVLTAFREDVALEPEELTEWFTASGWDEKSAFELTQRFYADVSLIGDYEETGRQTA